LANRDRERMLFATDQPVISGRTVEVEVNGPLILEDPELVVSAAPEGIGIATSTKTT